MSTSYLIACLGNIGPEYELTRHNIGFLAADALAEKKGLKFDTDRLAFTVSYSLKGKKIHLIKPTTYMNLSGRAVAYWLRELKIPLENLLVVVDDIHTDFGKMRLRSKGSSGGQNGLNSINEVLATENYSRLRLGIGSDFAKGKLADYVLSRFSPEQFQQLPVVLDKAAYAMESFCLEGVNVAMNKYNS